MMKKIVIATALASFSYLSMSYADALNITFVNNTAAEAHADYLSPGLNYKKDTFSYHSSTSLSDSTDTNVSFQVAQYGVSGVPFLKGITPKCYVQFSNNGSSWAHNTPKYAGCVITGSGDNYTITLSWPKVTVHYAAGTNNGNNVTDNTMKAINDFYGPTFNNTTFLIPNVLAMTKAQLAQQEKNPGWELQYAYDATRFPLWAGAYVLNAQGNEALKTNISKDLTGFTTFLNSHTQNGVLDSSGYWAVSTGKYKAGENASGDFGSAPALEGPAAVAAKAVGDTKLYDQLLKSLSAYDISKHTMTSVPDGNFVATSAPYFNAALDLLSQAELAGNGSLNITDNGATGYPSAKAFDANYQAWIKGGFLAPFTVTDKAGVKHDALRVLFSAYQAPSTEGGNVGKSPTVSEGMGYGLLIAYAANDQATFNKLLWFVLYTSRTEGCAGMNKTATACSIKSNYLMPWLVDETGKPFHYTIGGGYLTNGSATDADIQVAWAVRMASQRVTAGTWKQADFNGQSYAEILASMKTEINQFDIASDVKYMGSQLGQLYIPGSQWGAAGAEQMYPGYFTPEAFEALQ